MTQFTVNPHRADPYKNFKFRVKWDNQYVAGVSHVTALRRTTEVIQHREGGDPSTSRRSPGLTSFDPVTLQRGLTHDPAFEEWANLVWQLGSSAGNEVALKSFRKDISIELFNEAGQLVLRYKLYRCWVSEYLALPNLDANSSETAFQSITLQHEGWERDTSVVEPAEPGGKP